MKKNFIYLSLVASLLGGFSVNAMDTAKQNLAEYAKKFKNNQDGNGGSRAFNRGAYGAELGKDEKFYYGDATDHEVNKFHNLDANDKAKVSLYHLGSALNKQEKQASKIKDLEEQLKRIADRQEALLFERDQLEQMLKAEKNQQKNK